MYGLFSYEQASMYRPCHTHYVTVLVFECLYVRTYVRTKLAPTVPHYLQRGGV